MQKFLKSKIAAIFPLLGYLSTIILYPIALALAWLFIDPSNTAQETMLFEIAMFIPAAIGMILVFGGIYIVWPFSICARKLGRMPWLIFGLIVFIPLSMDAILRFGLLAAFMQIVFTAIYFVYFSLILWLGLYLLIKK